MSELVDLVDEYGQVQVVGLPRAEACANTDPDLYVPIAVAVVFNAMGHVLVQQRSASKIVDRKCLDFVCGIVSSGENPAATAARESCEETSVVPVNIELIAEGINVYRRYRYLFVGETDRQGMTVSSPNDEVEWAGLMDPRQAEDLVRSGLFKAVGDFHAHLTMAKDARQLAVQ